VQIHHLYCLSYCVQNRILYSLVRQWNLWFMCLGTSLLWDSNSCVGCCVTFYVDADCGHIVCDKMWLQGGLIFMPGGHIICITEVVRLFHLKYELTGYDSSFSSILCSFMDLSPCFCLQPQVDALIWWLVLLVEIIEYINYNHYKAKFMVCTREAGCIAFLRKIIILIIISLKLFKIVRHCM